MPNQIDLTGQTFGHWTVLREDTERKRGQGARWLCRCECGREKSVSASHLRRGNSVSCGECRFSPPSRKPEIFLTFAKEGLAPLTATLPEWAAMTGLSYDTLASRLRQGWTPEEILTTPAGVRRKSAKRAVDSLQAGENAGR